MTEILLPLSCPVSIPILGMLFSANGGILRVLEHTYSCKDQENTDMDNLC